MTKLAGGPKVEFVSERYTNEFVVEMTLSKTFSISHMTKMWTAQSEFMITEHTNTVAHSNQKVASQNIH